MSVLLDLSIFPLDQGLSLSGYVAPVIGMLRDSGHPYRPSPMGTTVETTSLAEALALIEKAQAILDGFGCERIYVVAKFDIRQGPPGRLETKLDAVRERIGAL
ncbi:MAG: thiamine-binding protein [Chromatiaceae bacterium]|nr:thiamine-binding protein [Chromatiaceae bacterium]